MEAHPAPRRSGAPRPFATELQGLPVVATATFLDGEWRNIVMEGTVPSSTEGQKGETTEGPRKNGDDPHLISRSLAEAEKAAVAFLSAAAKASTAGREEEADTVGNDQLGLDED